MTRIAKLTGGEVVESAWEYDGSCLPFDVIDGSGQAMYLHQGKVWDRDDRMALALGAFDSSLGLKTIRNLAVVGAYDIPGKMTCDGVIIRGKADVQDLEVTGIAGMGKPTVGPTVHGTGEVREVFGFRVTQNDVIDGFTYGGHLINRLKVRCTEEDAYVSAVCIASQEFTVDRNQAPVRTSLDWSLVESVEVDLACGNHAALTALQRVHFRVGRVIGPKNGFYCDTGLMNDVVVEGYRMRLSRAAVALGTHDGIPKGNLTVADTTFAFDGPGPFYAAELFDPDGLCGPVIFDRCRFVVPVGAKFYAWSTEDNSAPDVRFENCVLPKGALTHLGQGR